MSKGNKAGIAVLALLTIGLGIALAVVLTKEDTEKKDGKTTTEAATVTEPGKTSTSTSTVTDTVTEGSSTTTVVTESELEEVAEEYAEAVLNIESFVIDEVTTSSTNPDYAVITGSINGRPIGVWTETSNGQPKAVAGVKSAKAAPDGKGIPSDIKFPFPKASGSNKPQVPSKPSAPQLPGR